MPARVETSQGPKSLISLITANADTIREILGLGVEGSWTPAVAFGGVSTGVTYSTQVGRYVKNGNLVTVWLRIALTNNGSGTGSATVTGLPFAASTVSGIRFPGAVGPFGSTTMTAYVDSGASVISLAADDGTPLDETDITNTGAFSISLTYRTG